MYLVETHLIEALFSQYLHDPDGYNVLDDIKNIYTREIRHSLHIRRALYEEQENACLNN